MVNTHGMNEPDLLKLLDLLPDVAIHGCDVTGKILYWNDACARLHGYSADEAIGKNIIDLLLPPDMREFAVQAMRDVGKAAETHEFLPAGEHRLLRKDGSFIPVYTRHIAICRDGRPTALFYIEQDRSECQQLRHALDRSEARLKDFAGLLPQLVLEMDLTGRVTFANKNLQKAGGFTQEDLDRGLNVMDWVAPEERERAELELAKGADEPREGPYEFVVVQKDGSRLPVRAYASTVIDDGRLVGIRAIAVDITEEKIAEQAIRESEEQFRNIYEHSLVGIYRTTQDGRVLMANPALLRMLRYSSLEEMSQVNLETAGYAPGYSRADFRRHIESEGWMIGYESAWKRQDGTALFVRESGRCVRDAQGNVQYYEGTVEDVTALKQAEDELRRQRDFNRTLIQTSPAFFVAIAPDGKTLMMNRTMLTALGYTSEEVAGKDYLTTFIPAEDRPGVIKLMQDLMFTPTGAFHVNHLMARDGRSLLIEWHARQVVRDDGKLDYFFGVGVDITERQRIEEELRQAQKMEAVGRLAAGIAHDFNNQLTVVKGYCDLLLRELSPDNSLHEPISEIQSAAQRAAKLTNQLLAYSRKQLLRPKVVNLNHVLSEMADSLARMIGEDVRIEAHLASDLAAVLIDPVQAQQALMNLASNARDAMPHGGKLTIETANVAIAPSANMNDRDVIAGPHAMLTVTDDGEGMDAETLRHVFEPFYSTKPVGKGTGLGLSMVYGFVKQSGGHIKVDSKLGQGTSIRIYLPAISEVEENKAQSKPAGESDSAPDDGAK